MAAPTPLPLLHHLILLSLFFYPSLSLLDPTVTTTYPLHPTDLAALSSLKSSLTDLPGTHFFSTWDFTSPHPCSTFLGLTCSTTETSPSTLRITTLTLGTGVSSSAGVAGTLTSSISNLTELTQLILYPGFVTGPIPSQIGKLTNLRVISLTHNRLTGQIPSTISSLTNLHTLDLGYNFLTATIPPSLTQLPNLKVLILASNQLDGEIPTTISSELLHLDLKSNKLTGTLPSSFPSTLHYLSLSQNQLWGPLPQQSFSSLTYIDLSMNRFSGSIPHTLYNPAVTSFLLQRNNLTGSIPPPLNSSSSSSASLSSSSYGGGGGGGGEGSIVDVSHNSLSGELSTVFVGVEKLYLNNNKLVGEVPIEYAESVVNGKMKGLYLMNNYLSGFPLKPRLDQRLLPDSVMVCLSWNCMVPPIMFDMCPGEGSGGRRSRPAEECAVFRNGGNVRD